MKKILFIEDEYGLQKAMVKMLTDEGYQVLSALDGEVGLKIVKKELPDLILLDLILPKKDGFEVLKEIKKDETTKGIPIIILSNLERMEDVEKALQLGATTYLVKTNYGLDELLEKIKGVIE